MSIHQNKMIDNKVYIDSSMPKLQWQLRYNDNVYEFIESIPKWNKKVFQAVEDMDKEICVLSGILPLTQYPHDIILSIYKSKVIEKGFNECKDLCQLLQTVYNSLRDKRYTHLKKNIEIAYNLKDDIKISRIQ